MLLSGVFFLLIIWGNTATLALILGIKTKNESRSAEIVEEPITRQLLIQTNTGLPVINIRPSKANGTKPVIPNMIITTGPTDSFSQRVNAFLNFLTNSLSAFRPSLSSAGNLKRETIMEFPPIIIIPQITISFPTVMETGNQSPSPSPGIQDIHSQLLPINPVRGDEPIHTILPIVGNESNLEDEHPIDSIEEIKRRRVFQFEGSTVEKQADSIVNHIQNLIQQSAG